jgi:hypothetical protein
MDKETIEDIKWGMGAFRGAWLGLHVGFYDNRHFKIDDRCFGNQSVEELSGVLDFLQFGSLENLFDFVEEIATFLNDTWYYCDWVTPFTDMWYILSYWTWKSYFTHVPIRIITIVTSIKSLIDNLIRVFPNGTQAMYDMMFEDGKTFGVLFRAITGYKWSHPVTL